MKLCWLYVVAVLFFLQGCSTSPVAAWEKGSLAKAVMVRDTSSQHAALEQHSANSKEATQGGYSLGAGGCGCN